MIPAPPRTREHLADSLTIHGALRVVAAVLVVAVVFGMALGQVIEALIGLVMS